MRLAFAILALFAFTEFAAAADAPRASSRAEREARRSGEGRVVVRRIPVEREDCVITAMEELIDTSPVYRRAAPVAFHRWNRPEEVGRADRKFYGYRYLRDPRSPYGASGYPRFPGHARRAAACGRGW